jgi:hypothetical protein
MKEMQRQIHDFVQYIQEQVLSRANAAMTLRAVPLFPFGGNFPRPRGAQKVINQ